MDGAQDSKLEDGGDAIIVRADEVDQTGTDISTVSPTDQRLQAEIQDGRSIESTKEAPAMIPRQSMRPPTKPELRRDGSTPPAPVQPPPPTPPQQQLSDNPTDSLSLMQLKKLVAELPKVEERAYAFEYADAQPFPEELDEWFQYSEQDRMMLLNAKEMFDQKWKSFCDGQTDLPTEEPSWLEVNDDLRKIFLNGILSDLQNGNLLTRVEAVEVISYVTTGTWSSTAGLDVRNEAHEDEEETGESTSDFKFKTLQIKWIEQNVLLLQRCSGVQALYEYLRRIFDKDELVQFILSLRSLKTDRCCLEMMFTPR